MKASVVVAAVIALAPLSQAHAVEYKVDFSIESSNPTVSGTPPYRLPSTYIDLQGSFTTHRTGMYIGLLGVGSIDSLDFTAESRTYTLADLGLATAIFDTNGVPFRFALDLDSKLFDVIGANENGSDFELNIATNNYIYCEDCVTFKATEVGVSAVPLPASAPMFGAALLALGAVGYGLKRKKAAAAA